MPLTAYLDQDVATLEASAVEVKTPALESVLAAIKADSATASDSYLRDTVVPHGGE